MGYQPSDTTYTDRYRKMVDSSVDALFLLDPAGKILDTNRTAEKRSGYSREQLLSMTALDLTPERLHGQIRAELKEAIEGGRLFESIERRKDGSEFPVEIGVEAHKIAGELLICSSVRDISWRENSSATKTSDDRYLTLFENANDAIFVMQGDRFEDCNRATEAMFGLPRSEIVGKRLFDVSPVTQPDGAESKRKALDKIEAALSGDPQQFEWQHRRQDGQTFDTEVYLQRIMVAAEPNLLAIVRDISEHKRSVARLRRANRILETLSACNQVLFHATDEGAIWQGLCRTFVEAGGYRMCWAGCVEHDENKTIRPVAHSGFEDGYLESVSITWDDTERGQGPTGTSVRTGKPQPCQDMLTDPAYAPWREDATRRGYASSIALPLLFEGEVFCVLNVYSRASHAFDEEEVRLLTVMADNLSHGVMSLRAQLESKRAQSDLAKSEERYRDLYDDAPHAYFTVDIGGRVLQANRRAEELTGRALDELVGLPVLDLYADTPEGKTRAKTVLGRFKAGEPIESEELEMKRANGEHIQVNLTVKPVRDEHGNVVRSRSMFVDITGNRRAENELRRLTVRTQQYLDLAAVMLVVIDARGKVVLMNQKGLCILGYEQEDEVIGKNWFDTFLPTAIRDEVKAVSRRILKGEIAPLEDYENPVLTKSGEERLIAWHNTDLRDDAGRIVGHLSSGEDITDRKRVEEELRDSEANLRAYFNHVAVGAAQIDTEGRFIRVNDRLCALTGYDREELLGGMGPLDLDHPDDREADQERQAQFFAGQMPVFEIEKRFVRKDGQVIWVHVTATMVTDERTQGRYTAGIIEDITERKRAEAVLHENETRMRLSAEAGNVGFWDWDLITNKVHFSPEWKGQIGYQDDEISNDFSEWQIDTEGRFIRVNDRLCALTGYDREELLGGLLSLLSLS